jgi:hypothetical protein
MLMSRWFGLCGVLAAGILGLGLMGGTARAGEPFQCYPSQYITVCRYVTCYETRLEAYTKLVTWYDSCGCPHTATQTCYREVQVPVTKKVCTTEKVALY